MWMSKTEAMTLTVAYVITKTSISCNNSSQESYTSSSSFVAFKYKVIDKFTTHLLDYTAYSVEITNILGELLLTSIVLSYLIVTIEVEVIRTSSQATV
jgi:hypothetical protein